MSLASKSDKIWADHLGRRALLYVRQSTLTQGRENVGSPARQYDLVKRAQELGWNSEQIEVVDQDQGRSGASAAGRDGFQRVVAEVGMGHVGALFSLAVSRLARSSSDWYRLLEICALTQTLVVDEESVYDPSNYNDRLLLGFKGTMSEAELHWLRARLMGGRMKKAESGELRIPLPTGLVYTEDGQIRRDPDEEVQAAVQLLFDVFKEKQTARGVVRAFRDQGLMFPTRELRGPDRGKVKWRRLGRERVSTVLHNPLYAGAYAYGRTAQRVQSSPGENLPHKKRVCRPDPNEWAVPRVDAHPGYITWEQYLRTQKRLKDNSHIWAESRGAAREGSALLQGIVLCGVCGKRMRIRYIENGATPVYGCQAAKRRYGDPTCQTIRGDRVDAGVAELFLEAMTPAQLSISIAALEQVENRARQVERQWELRLERVRYEAELARRRYTAVEPENRLVARSLERDWNQKLVEVERQEREYAIRPGPAELAASPRESAQVLRLAQDLRAVWEAATTTDAERKHLLRFLVADVTLTQKEKHTHLGVRWQTGAWSEIEVPRPKRIDELRRSSPVVVESVRQLASNHTDHQIAVQLNRKGLTTGTGQAFDNARVRRVRRSYAIPTGCPEKSTGCQSGQRGDGRYSTQAAAEMLNISPGTVRNWCKSGKLDYIRSVPGGPRWIQLTADTIAKLRKPVRQSRELRPQK